MVPTFHTSREDPRFARLVSARSHPITRADVDWRIRTQENGIKMRNVRPSLAIKVGSIAIASALLLAGCTDDGRDGRVETIADVVRHYAGIDPASLHAKDGRSAKPLNLTKREQTDLVIFLESLSTFNNPWRPDDGGRCD